MGLVEHSVRPTWFLSYNSRFLAEAKRLCDRIEADAPVRVWLDDREILPGDPFLDRMEEGLRIADTILVLIGKEQGRYQRKEVEMMIVNEATGNKSKRIVPLLLPEATQDDVPYWLRARSQVLDLDAGWPWLKSWRRWSSPRPPEGMPRNTGRMSADEADSMATPGKQEASGPDGCRRLLESRRGKVVSGLRRRTKRSRVFRVMGNRRLVG
jgi:hypothetical protein